MHERTQRAIARMTFVFCCALPTIATLSIIIVSWTPWWHRRCLRALERELSLHTQLVVRVEDFERPSPSMLRVHNVSVYESEKGRLVAAARRVEWIERGDDRALLLHQPRIRSSQFSRLWELLHDGLLCRPQYLPGSLHLAAGELTIESRSGSMTFVDLNGWVRPQGERDATEAIVRGLPADQNLDFGTRPPQPIRFTVVRDRGDDSPWTMWALATGDSALPCSAIADYLSPLKSLGENATFSGTLRYKQFDDGWAIDLSGSKFDGIALSRWLEPLPHRLTGTASIEFDRCRVARQQRITKQVDVAGLFSGHSGSIGPTLLQSAREHLGCATIVEDQSVTYDRMRLGFRIEGSRLSLVGRCSEEPGFEGLGPGVALRVGVHPLAITHDMDLQSRDLQVALAHDHSVTVPLSEQTSPLIEFLMPPSRPPSSDPPRPRIQTARPWQGGDPVEQPDGAIRR